MKKLGTLQKIRVSGYKSVKGISLDLTQLNILLGPNGAGKSNFISIFKFINKIVEGELQLFVSQQGGADKFLFNGPKVTQRISIKLYFKPNGYEISLVPTVTGNLIIFKEAAHFFGDEIGYEGGTKTITLAKPGDTESKLKSRREYITNYIVEYFKEWKIYHFHDTSDSSPMKRMSRVIDNITLSSQGENIAAFLYKIRDTKSYQDIVYTIQRVAPYFKDFVLSPEEGNNDYIRLRWSQKGSDVIFDASDLSDGTLRFICLTTLLLQPKLPKTIILDEPELGLHPFALHLLAGIFKSVSTKCQIITSTQSVTLANQFDWQDIIIVEQDDGTQFKRLEGEELSDWLDEYGIGEIWEKNIIGGTPR